MRLRAAFPVVCLLLLLYAPVEAKTGGRAGGGSWSKPSSSSSSRPSSSSSSRPSSSSSYKPSSSSSSTYRPSTTPSTRSYYPSTSTTYYGGSPSTPSTAYDTSYTPSSGTTSYTSYDSHSGSSGGGSGFTLIFIVVVIGVVIFAAVLWFRNSDSGYASYSPSYAGGGDMDSVDVSVLRVALDGRARKFVQTELARIAKVADTATEEGRLLLLREVSMLLRRVRDAWVYGGAVNEPMRGIEAAKACFDAHVDDARMKINLETVSNVDGVVQIQSAPNYTPRSDQGEGVILVSLIVAARSELFTVANIGDGETLRKAIENAPHRTASDLVAVEIVWMPSEDNDRMSSIELEAKYPHPQLIPITGALVGKTFCTYCSGPFPAELVNCPHCGAPAPGHDEVLPRAA